MKKFYEESKNIVPDYALHYYKLRNDLTVFRDEQLVITIREKVLRQIHIDH